MVRVDDDLDVERLALQDLRGDVDGGDLDLGVGPGRQGDGRDADPGVERGLDGVAGGLVAVGEDDDLGDVERRDRRGGHLDGGGEVGPLVVGDGSRELPWVWIEPGSAAKSR